MRKVGGAIAMWCAVGLALGELIRSTLATHPFVLSFFASIPVFICAAVILWFGWRVRRLKKGKGKEFPQLLAARTYMWATASIRAGALMGGMASVVAVAYFIGINTAFTATERWSWALLAIASILLALVGAVVEKWCRIDGNDVENNEQIMLLSDNRLKV